MRYFVLLILCFSSAVYGEWVLEDVPISARHEAGMVKHQNALYLIGGRGKRPIDVMDIESGKWQKSGIVLNTQIHHFQPVSFGNEILLIGGFQGGFPNELPIAEVIKINTLTGEIDTQHQVPTSRQRGSAGVAVYKNKVYVVGGITNGHMSGTVKWFDEYDPVTGQWRELPDAPNARDHFQAIVVGDKLYAIAGRRTSHATGQAFDLTESKVDVFDFISGKWTSLPQSKNLPTPRAGNMIVSLAQDIIVVGGESGTQKHAHKEVEAFNTDSMIWRTLPELEQGRHGGGAAIAGEHLIAVSGCLMRGGRPELATHERLQVSLFKESEQVKQQR